MLSLPWLLALYGGGAVPCIRILLLLLSFLLSSSFRDRCHWVTFVLSLCYWRTTVRVVGSWPQRSCGAGLLSPSFGTMVVVFYCRRELYLVSIAGCFFFDAA